jgi:uncharacterized protein (TIGR03084 family)
VRGGAADGTPRVGAICADMCAVIAAEGVVLARCSVLANALGLPPVRDGAVWQPYSAGTMEVFDDLVAEQDRLEVILSGLDEAQWQAPSVAAGWSVADVVLHLAQTEETVVATVAGEETRSRWAGDAETLDEAMDRRVRAERAPGAVVFGRWRAARRAAVPALRAADPERPLEWADVSLKPKTLATTRLAEHWAHGLDITEPLAIPFPDTDRLWHIAWLAHNSLPYAFNLAGQEPHDVFCELTAPDYAVRRYGPAEADSSITGSASAFCRVAARRLPADASGLEATGPYGRVALDVLRTYAG